MIGNRRARVLAGLFLVAFLAESGQAEDARGSSDHPLFPNRMPGYAISNYKTREFEAYKLSTNPARTVEGKYTRISYYLKNAREHPGETAIRRNYETAIQAVGGKVVPSVQNVAVFQATRNGAPVWAELTAGRGRYYVLTIIETKAMEQVITANAMAAAIDSAGFIALDIRFATGKADILPESQPVIAQIATMLRERPQLLVGVEGHTDGTGTAAGNRVLSKARAESVVKAIAAAGIDRSRMSAAGHGQDKPVADNATEEGRARNRRVEIVRKRS